MTVVMFDSITVDPLRGVASTSGEAVAGYVDGRWPDFAALAAAFPNDHHLSIAVRASDDADCLDVENGDAAPGQAPGWVRRQLARGVWRPCLYANLATMPAVSDALRAAGFQREQVRLWVAHYTDVAHIEPNSDATQWTERAFGRNLDESLCLDDFFPNPKPPPPPEGTVSIALERNEDGRLEAVVHLQDGSVKHTWQVGPGKHWQGEDPNDRTKQAQWYPLGSPGK